MAPTNVRRGLVIADDITGGTPYDSLTTIAADSQGYTKDINNTLFASPIWLPGTGGTFDDGQETKDRNSEIRARRAGTAPIPFRLAPGMTIPIPAYPSLLGKLFKKNLGGADTVTGSAGLGYLHSFAILGFGTVALPSCYVMMVEDDLVRKISGAVVDKLSLSFPLDDEGSGEAAFAGLWYKNDPAAPPTSTFTGLSQDPLVLRDARAWYDAVNEVETLMTTGTPTGGSFTLVYTDWDGTQGTTGTIAFNASAGAVQTALEAILGVGNVVCAGGPLPTGVTITFTGALGGRNVNNLALGTNSLTGGASPNINVVETTPGGTSIPDLTGFSFSFDNQTHPRWYAGRNVELRSAYGTNISGGLGTNEDLRRTRRNWFPQERRLGAMQQVTGEISFGNVDTASEIANDFQKIQRLTFECRGAAISGTTPTKYETLTITMWNVVYTGGGADAITRDSDLGTTLQFGSFFSETQSQDVAVSLLTGQSTAYT